MTDLLIRIENASRAAQRALAIAILACLAALPAAAIFVIIAAFGAINDNIQSSRDELGRLKAIIAWATPLAKIPKDASQTSPYLSGDNASLAQAALRRAVTEAAARSNVTVASLSGQAIHVVDGVPLIGVKIQAEGTLPALHALVIALENSSPGLMIEGADIRGTNAVSQDRLSEPIQLAAQLTIVGAADPSKVGPEEPSK